MASDDHTVKTLVCVGGPSAGKRVTVPNHYLTVNVINPVPEQFLTRTRAEADAAGNPFAGFTVYARHALTAGDDHFEYLAPDNLAGSDQLIELLEGYRRG